MRWEGHSHLMGWFAEEEEGRGGRGHYVQEEGFAGRPSQQGLLQPWPVFTNTKY